MSTRYVFASRVDARARIAAFAIVVVGLVLGSAGVVIGAANASIADFSEALFRAPHAEVAAMQRHGILSGGAALLEMLAAIGCAVVVVQRPGRAGLALAMWGATLALLYGALPEPISVDPLLPLLLAGLMFAVWRSIRVP